MVPLVGAAMMSLSACGQHTDVQSKANTIQTVYGNTFGMLDEQVTWSTASNLMTYDLHIAVRSDSSEDERRLLQDMTFQEWAGPRATSLGFRKVAIIPVDGTETKLDLFGMTFFAHVDIGPGPLAKPDVYEEAADGTWSHSGREAPAIEYVSVSALKTGEKFGLTFSIEDYPKATYIYDCISCGGDSQLFFDHYLDMVNSIVIPMADRDRLTTIKVLVFLRARKNMWDFPPLVNLRYTKHSDGRWWGPIGSPEKIEAAFVAQMTNFQNIGRKMRHETTPK